MGGTGRVAGAGSSHHSSLSVGGSVNVGLPDRTLDTMSEAIAQSSPSGTMSKRARKRAQERLRVALFGEKGLQPTDPQQSKREQLLQQASELRELAARGMKPRAHLKRAEDLEAMAKRTQDGED